ncbi:putative 4-hydroxybenzoate polyprenyltransferase [bacterium]|nr:putative 4-hydroxybenzoate polyprenyltransferase [bacterium]
MNNTWTQFQEFLKDIKFSHSIFAFPFAVSAFFFEQLPMPSMLQVALLCVCMVSARSFAMGVNRLFDWKLDLVNPRTAVRSIPSGKLQIVNAGLFSLLFAGLFVGSTYFLSAAAFYASVPVLLFLGGYSLMKRVHFLTHLYLGLCLGLAPSAVYIALTGELSSPLVLLGLGIAVWTAGFDILYSLQDMDHDKSAGLKSVPSYFGAKTSIYISRFLFSSMILFLVCAGYLVSFGAIYYLGVVCVGAVLVYEHYLVRDAVKGLGIPNIGKAFFDLNAWVSVGFMCFVILERLV